MLLWPIQFSAGAVSMEGLCQEDKCECFLFDPAGSPGLDADVRL